MALDITALVVAVLLGLVIPYVTELVTKANAPDWVRTLSNVALSALAGALTTVTISDYDRWEDYVLAIVGAWLVTARVYFAGGAKQIRTATAPIGIGPRGN